MSNFKVKLIGAGVGALLKSKEIQDILNKEATVIKKRCDNLKNNTLLKAVHK